MEFFHTRRVPINYLHNEFLDVQRLDDIAVSHSVLPVEELGRHHQIIAAAAIFDARVVQLAQQIPHGFAPILALLVRSLKFGYGDVSGLVLDPAPVHGLGLRNKLLQPAIPHA